MDNYIIDRNDTIENLLSKEHYFQSLLQVLHSNDILNNKELENIQVQILDILRETANYYTKAESYSVRVEVAEQIMLSIYYTIGSFLKGKTSIKEKITLIKENAMKYLFSEGEKVLKIKIEESKELLKNVQKSKLKTSNYAYIDTIDYGIPLFFIEYDSRFAAHEMQGSIDYPLAIDEMELVGIEYISEYLKKIDFENQFCSHFDSYEIENLLKSFDKNSDHILINIFELVLTNYLGCMVLGKRGITLDITDTERRYLKNKLGELKEEEFNEVISRIVEGVCQEFNINDINFINYINKTIYKIMPSIKKNIENNKLENTFITFKNEDENLIRYEDGESLENSRFKDITEEIRDCDKVDDKIQIIRKEIHSLRDLVDVLGSDCIFDYEFIEIFKVLDDFEISLLLKYIPNDSVMDVDYGTESDKEWHEKLEEYLDMINEEKKSKIITESLNIIL
ncbi:DUF6179 domain-containing protein [Clostridium beijerinckii]|uniref:Uncharacterized protein n=2 Tax=Clostridium beijerinckii TaxID=1520 RepID=A0AAE2RTB8_CLOBE|nr:DUF6179 domain-containing protein [Clostridium beijerinckii]ABR36148.1 conserved hypothetical protein [Clostridium beijerinckii NCIMB 8052]AIU00870.1 hypothetical protein Cbs_4038 [Clostridium beijerinckii ATCC 35702]MBF7809204.1 hypothetical protein [Clostridium beijerinckii]NOW89700.1 hypothetical protein [Clostridium beijerinckii]NRT22794.1 hypothetical protein [Clostridium beijerinckii]